MEFSLKFFHGLIDFRRILGRKRRQNKGVLEQQAKSILNIPGFGFHTKVDSKLLKQMIVQLYRSSEKIQEK